jgi:hypothetical protein
MKTIILATAAVLSLGIGSAFAGDGEGPAANTLFTELPGVVAQAPVQQAAPSAVASNQHASGIGAFIAEHRTAISLFPPNQNQGNGS